jgi:hypothetical protein
MFETEGFKNELTRGVARGTEISGLLEYETRIVDYLQRLASENESPLMEREVRMHKVASERRGVPDALNSATELTKEASKYAAADRRTLLRMSDIEAAYRAKFCQFWPFCKS